MGTLGMVDYWVYHSGEDKPGDRKCPFLWMTMD
jgi:hypothetical protein